jgi:hypothetical protein
VALREAASGTPKQPDFEDWAQLSVLGLTEFPIHRKNSNHETEKGEAPSRIALEIGFTIHLVHLAG